MAADLPAKALMPHIPGEAVSRELEQTEALAAPGDECWSHLRQTLHLSSPNAVEHIIWLPDLTSQPWSQLGLLQGHSLAAGSPLQLQCALPQTLVLRPAVQERWSSGQAGTLPWPEMKGRCRGAPHPCPAAHGQVKPVLCPPARGNRLWRTVSATCLATHPTLRDTI